MFTVHEKTATSATFHFDAPNEVPRRWHASKVNGKWDFVTDMCNSKPRKPGIPTALRDATFSTLDEAIEAVLALNT